MEEEKTDRMLKGVVGNINRVGAVTDDSFKTIQAVHVAFAMSRSLDKKAAMAAFEASWDRYAQIAQNLLRGKLQ